MYDYQSANFPAVPLKVHSGISSALFLLKDWSSRNTLKFPKVHRKNFDDNKSQNEVRYTLCIHAFQLKALFKSLANLHIQAKAALPR